jgi:hypothetical protein
MSRLLVPYLFQVGGKLSAGLYRTRTERELLISGHVDVSFSQNFNRLGRCVVCVHFKALISLRVVSYYAGRGRRRLAASRMMIQNISAHQEGRRQARDI